MPFTLCVDGSARECFCYFSSHESTTGQGNGLYHSHHYRWEASWDAEGLETALKNVHGVRAILAKGYLILP